ncbi:MULTISPECIES: hypothetical protein [Cellulomonas]|nr:MULTISPECIES: hypothetical protein [Cellulomonas]
MNFVLNLQEAAPAEPTDADRCSLLSFASCFVCSLSVASVALCLG